MGWRKGHNIKSNTRTHTHTHTHTHTDWQSGLRLAMNFDTHGNKSKVKGNSDGVNDDNNDKTSMKGQTLLMNR